MRATKRIALAGISAAFSTICVIASVYVPFLDMSFLVLSSLAILLPISKGDYVGAFLAYLATSLLGILMTGQLIKALPYVIFFGPHPIILSLAVKLKLPWPAAYLFKLAFANLAIFLAIRFLGLAVDFNELLGFDFPMYLIYIGGSLFFLAYDWLIGRIKLILAYYIDKMMDGRGKR